MYTSSTFLAPYTSTDKRLILRDGSSTKVGGINVCRFQKAVVEGKQVVVSLSDLRLSLDFATETEAKVALLTLETAIESLLSNCVIAGSDDPGQYSSGSVTVTASGTDTYTGVANPTITSYDIGTIYITTFANANTVTVPTLNIAGIGVLPIVKSDETGLIALEVGDIHASVAYFLVYNGTQFQLFTDSPVSIPGTYTNLNPVPATFGGVIIGTTFNNVTTSSVFDMLLYPYLVPNFTGFSISGQSTSLEVGASIATGNKTFIWSTSNSSFVKANTVRITAASAGNAIILDASPNDGSQVINFGTAITRTSPGTFTWTIRATRTNNSFMTLNYSIGWNYKLYYGTNASSTLTEVQAEAMTGMLANTIGRTYAYGTSGYKYLVVPNNIANPVLFKDNSTGLSVGMADATDGYTDTNSGAYNFKYLSLTNTFGITQTYRVYRTKNVLGGAINIVVS